MKTCPFCAEQIQDAAIVCKHCGRELAPVAPPPTPTPAPAAPVKKRANWWPLILIVCGVAFVGWCNVAGPGPTTTRERPEDAATLTALVEQSLQTGLIMKIEAGTSHAYVNPDGWAVMSVDQKEVLARALAHHFKARGDTGFAHIYDGRTGKHIAKMTSFGQFSVD